MIIGFEDIVDEDEDETPASDVSIESKEEADITVPSPLSGKAVPLSEVKDATFSQEILGKGAAIIPDKGVVYAPFDGKIDVMFETGHALGLTADNGVELLIHVGMDTVNLEGKYFYPKKATGDTIKKGDILLEFDMDGIINAGYDITTPVVVSNTEKYTDIVSLKEGKTAMLEDLVKIR